MADEQAMTITDADMTAAGLPPNVKMAPGLAIFFNENLYARCKAVALRMSEAKGVIGPHLIGEPSACMAVLSRAITWNLDPFAVAQSTYVVKGKIGYEGKLVQAILENSGAIEGRIMFTYKGDWAKLRGKFKIINGVPTIDWKPEDEADLSVIVSAQVKGETERREEEFWLAEMYPRNSTLWPLRPKQQMAYASVRAFSNIACPGIIMGIPFDVDPSGMGGDGMMDITPPKPTLNEFSRSPARDPAMGDWIVKLNSAEKLTEVGDIRAAGLKELPKELHAAFEEAADNRAHQITGGKKDAMDVVPEEPTDQQGDADQGAPDGEGTAPEAEKKPEPEKAQEKPAAAKPAAKGKQTARHPADQETALARGKRLLAKVDSKEDIEELLKSISDELKGADLIDWKQACADRIEEIGK